MAGTQLVQQAQARVGTQTVAAEAQPPEMRPNVMTRVLIIIAENGKIKAAWERDYNFQYHKNLADADKLADEIRHNSYWTAGSQVLVIPATMLGAYAGLDPSSASTLCNTGGQGVTSYLSGLGGTLQHKKQLVDGKVQRGQDSSRRLSEYAQQVHQFGMRVMDLLSQMRGGRH